MNATMAARPATPPTTAPAMAPEEIELLSDDASAVALVAGADETSALMSELVELEARVDEDDALHPIADGAERAQPSMGCAKAWSVDAAGKTWLAVSPVSLYAVTG